MWDSEAARFVAETARDESLTVADVLPGSPADLAGLQAGQKIVDVPQVAREYEDPSGILGLSKTLKTRGLYERLMLAVTGVERSLGSVKEKERAKKDALVLNELVLTIDGMDQNLRLLPERAHLPRQALIELGHRPARSEPVTYGFAESVTQGFYHSHIKISQILRTLGGLFSGEVSITSLSGPVIIARLSYSLSEYGTGTLLFFLAFISLNLAVVNLLPIPVLDGGLLLIVIIEKLKGSPLNERMMGYVNFAAFLFVIGLMLFVVFNDIRLLSTL